MSDSECEEDYGNRLNARFEFTEGEDPEFDDIEHKFSYRKDLHAFILLDQISPTSGSIIASAEHDELYLAVDCRELEKTITDEQIRELVACGVSYDQGNNSLWMFA